MPIGADLLVGLAAIECTIGGVFLGRAVNCAGDNLSAATNERP